ncbi:MAG: diguanylate cyclase [Pseudomonadota bacterium]|nr:diguanylate cyclase [Pseudomonadota bacterium]
MKNLHFWDLGGVTSSDEGRRLLKSLLFRSHLRSTDFRLERKDGLRMTACFRHVGTVSGDSNLIECVLDLEEVGELALPDMASAAKSVDQRTLCSHHFEVTAQKEIARTREQGTPLGLLSIVVDRVGASDASRSARTTSLLGGFASICGTLLRATDIVCRVEDAVYVALLPGNNTSAARRAAERLRTAIAATASLAQKSGLRRVTVSIGVVATRTGRTTYLAMRSRADSKRDDAAYSGGNRVAG